MQLDTLVINIQNSVWNVDKLAQGNLNADIIVDICWCLDSV